MRRELQRRGSWQSKRTPSKTKVKIGITATAIVVVLLGSFLYYRSKKEKVFEVTLAKSQTANVSDGLTITVTDLKRKEAPERYTVFIKVLYKDLPEMQLKDGEVGSIIKYPKEHGYTIEVLKTNSDFARFLIKKDQ